MKTFLTICVFAFVVSLGLSNAQQPQRGRSELGRNIFPTTKEAIDSIVVEQVGRLRV